MKIALTIARILLGFVFVVFGLNGFLSFMKQPTPEGVAGQFLGSLASTQYFHVVFAFQLAGGVILLVNRYVPLGLIFLAPVIVNILCFHIFMAPSGIGPGLVVTILWLATFWSVRSAFSGIIQQRVEEKS
jgi:hypothetical protein